MEKGQWQELLRLGLTEGEAKVYIALLELGSSTVGPIFHKSGVAYSNIYGILQRLVEKGIVSFVIKSKTKHFQAGNPTNLYLYLEMREKELQQQKKSLNILLPQLNKLQESTPSQEAEVYIGTKGLRTAYEKLFNSAGKKDEDLFFYIHEASYGEEADTFYFSIGSILKKRPLRGISNNAGRTSVFLKNFSSLQIRYTSVEVPGNIEVCGDRVLIVSWVKPIVGILIHSASIAHNFRTYFEKIWALAKE